MINEIKHLHLAHFGITEMLKFISDNDVDIQWRYVWDERLLAKQSCRSVAVSSNRHASLGWIQYRIGTDTPAHREAALHNVLTELFMKIRDQ